MITNRTCPILSVLCGYGQYCRLQLLMVSHSSSSRRNQLHLRRYLKGAIRCSAGAALVIYRFTMHSIETPRMTGEQRINKYTMLLLEHRALYFHLHLAYEGLATWMALSSLVLYIPLATLYINISTPFRS
ncbi:hypothetical protein HD554DRAFT_1771387 [Boletus coccyginus]|nr:hypothetical protein HD554DRAFT_1771387 [Boletus coccyginus]